MALSHQLGDLAHELLDLLVGLLPQRHHGALLGDVHLLLVEVLLELFPNRAFAVLLVVHLALLGLVLEGEVVQFFVERVHFLVALQLLVVVQSVVGFLLGRGRHAGHHGLLVDVDLVAGVAPLGGHELGVLALVGALRLVVRVLVGLAGAVHGGTLVAVGVGAAGAYRLPTGVGFRFVL